MYSKIARIFLFTFLIVGLSVPVMPEAYAAKKKILKRTKKRSKIKSKKYAVVIEDKAEEAKADLKISNLRVIHASKNTVLQEVEEGKKGRIRFVVINTGSAAAPASKGGIFWPSGLSGMSPTFQCPRLKAGGKKHFVYPFDAESEGVKEIMVTADIAPKKVDEENEDNNSSKIRLTVKLKRKPDLVISEFRIGRPRGSGSVSEVVTGEKFRINCRVENRGDGPTPENIPLEFVVRGAACEGDNHIVIPALEAGAVSARYTQDCSFDSGGAKFISVAVNSNENFQESNMNNNTSRGRLNVSEPNINRDIPSGNRFGSSRASGFHDEMDEDDDGSGQSADRNDRDRRSN